MIFHTIFTIKYRLQIISLSDWVLLMPKYHDTLLLVSEHRSAMKYCKTLILAIFIMLAQVLSITNLSLGVLDQHAFGEIPGNVTKLTENAVILNSMGRFDNALSYLDKVLSIDPNNVLALINKGISLDGLGRFRLKR